MNAGACHSGAGALIFALLFGCQASVNADAQLSGEGAKGRAQAEMSGSGEGEGELTRSALAQTSQASALAAPSRALLGARHDLKLQAGKGSGSCECLAVALGGARAGGMAWSGSPPELDESKQLSIALSSEGQACKDEPKKSLGASYWGYRISGNDVVVLVEAARGGRPLTSGAVIPKPVGEGQVFIAPAGKNLPYGRSPDGKGLCKIGNPGPPRSAPFSELEIGNDAPRPATGNVTRSDSAATTRQDDGPTTIELPPN